MEPWSLLPVWHLRRAMRLQQSPDLIMLSMWLLRRMTCWNAPCLGSLMRVHTIRMLSSKGSGRAAAAFSAVHTVSVPQVLHGPN